MQILKRILLVIYFSALAVEGFGQIAFYKYFTNNGYDYGQGAVQLEDSSYVICGSSSSFTDGPSQAFLLKIDSLGEYQWSHHYGGDESEWGRRVLYKNGFGYFLTGHQNSIGNGGYDAFLMKIDLNGTLEWQQNYGGTEWEKINDAALTSDTGTLLIGQTNSTIGGDNDIYIIRTAINGDTLWTKQLGGIGEDIATSITQYNDSTFFVSGEMYDTDSMMTKGFVLSIKDNGELLWLKKIGLNGNYGIKDIDFDQAAGKVNFVGWKFNTISNSRNNLFGKVSASGILDFEDSEVSADQKIYDEITQFGTSGKNYVAFKYIDGSSFQDGFDIAISKLGAGLYWDGTLLSINHPLEDATGQLIPTSDGGALAVGYSCGYGAGGANVFVTKIGPNDLYPIIHPMPAANSLVEITENTALNGFHIFPNPANDLIHINTGKEEYFSYEMQDLNGKTILADEFYSSAELKLNFIQSGVYLLKVSSNTNGLETIKRVIIN